MKSHRYRRIALFTLGSIFVLFIFCFFVLYPPFEEYPYKFYDRTSVQRMIEKWGDTPFDAAQFKKGSPKQRAAMAADIVRNQKYVGQSIDLVFLDLGSEYILESAGTGLRNSTEYYLEFHSDDKNRRVKSVYVVQRCCRNPYASFWHGRGLLKQE
jgi:hypothetical protein